MKPTLDIVRDNFAEPPDRIRSRIPRVAIVGTGFVESTTAHALLMSGLTAAIVPHGSRPASRRRACPRLTRCRSVLSPHSYLRNARWEEPKWGPRRLARPAAGSVPEVRPKPGRTTPANSCDAD